MACLLASVLLLLRVCDLEEEFKGRGIINTVMKCDVAISLNKGLEDTAY